MDLFLGGAFLGAGVSALVDEVIAFAKQAYRCKEECSRLEETLTSIQPLLMSIVDSPHCKSPYCQEWLLRLQAHLVKAKGIVEGCAVKGSKLSLFKFVNKWKLSGKIQEIHLLIKEELSLRGNLAIMSMLQELSLKVDGSSPTSHVTEELPTFEVQHVPVVTVAFENNPFATLRELILSMPITMTKTIGIRGKGGSGKTLLAKMVNNDEEIRKKYGDGSVLWITIGQDASVPSIYGRMGKFLKDGGAFERDMSGQDLEAQRSYLIEAFKQKRALVILDDIWRNCEKNHTMIYWLDIFKGDGSTTLITTRDGKVLDCARATERIEVESLSKEESWKLFSFHAFAPNMPPSRVVEDIAVEICNECKGLPLALAVFGSALWDSKGERDWKYALSCLQSSEALVNSSTIEDELFERLKFSYDKLADDAKKCFLYFAAFPEDFCIPTRQLYSIWQAEELFGLRGHDDALNIGRMNLITLADRSLIELDEDGEHAKIHDVLRDLAVRIIRDAKIDDWAYECQFEPGKQLKTLPKIRKTTTRVSFIGTRIANLDPQLLYEGHNLRVCLLSSFQVDSGKGFPHSLSSDVISSMKGLLYLTLENCNLLFKELPASITELTGLMHLDLSGCKSLKELPEGIKELKSLTHLYLSKCASLKELPEGIKGLESLTHLDISRCGSLKKLPEGIKGLKSLTYLDLSLCGSLKELPEGIMELKYLMHLYLNDCASLEKLPEGIKGLECLTHLDLRRCRSLNELPEGIKELKYLTNLDLSDCASLEKLPEGIKGLQSLTYLDLSRCRSLKELPKSIKELKYLTHSYLSDCSSLEKLPECIKGLESLTHLYLSRCRSLKELLEGVKELKSLTHLYLRDCASLEKLPEGIKGMESLTHLDLSGCGSLKELPEGLNELKSLTHLYLSWCGSLKELPEGIKELKSLTHLYLRECASLEKLPEGIKGLESLTHLNLSRCGSLKELPGGIKELKSLTHLYLSRCDSMKELSEGIKELKSLTHLYLRGCDFLKELPEDIKELKALTHLNLSWCGSLKELPEGIKELKSLRHLDLSRCGSLKELPKSIKELKSLTHLYLNDCASLEKLPEDIKGLQSLTHFDLSQCRSLKELPKGIKELKSLTHLDLRGCNSLEELPEGIKVLKFLMH